MNYGTLKITAIVDVPETTTVGDRIEITGTVTINAIEASLISVPNQTDGDQYTIGRSTIKAWANEGDILVIDYLPKKDH